MSAPPISAQVTHPSTGVETGAHLIMWCACVCRRALVLRERNQQHKCARPRFCRVDLRLSAADEAESQWTAAKHTNPLVRALTDQRLAISATSFFPFQLSRDPARRDASSGRAHGLELPLALPFARRATSAPSRGACNASRDGRHLPWKPNRRTYFPIG